MNDMTNVPNWSGPGVQLKTLETGLPVAGSAGAHREPDGNPTPFSETVSPRLGSEVVTVNVSASPTWPFTVEPQVGRRMDEDGADYDDHLTAE